jgi:thiol-disulfide isomerase/thioredoxin
MNKLALLLISAVIVILLMVLAGSAKAEVHSDYMSGFTASHKDHKTFVVVIGADWCPPCKKMKAMINGNKSVADGGHLVIIDYKSPIAKKLYRGSSVPALIRFKWDGKQWIKTTITGGQSYNQLKRFIRG